MSAARHWTAAEDTALLLDFGIRSLPVIAARLDRSVRAINVRLNRHHKRSLRMDIPRVHGMSIADVAVQLGTDSRRVDHWIERKWLAAQKARGIYAYWSIRHEDVTAFLFARGGLMESLKPDVYWADVFAEARAALEARYIKDIDLYQLLVLTGRGVLHLRTQHGFPAAGLQLVGNYTERTAVIAWLNTHAQYWTAAARRELQRA